jgi:hypothetical protein
VDIEHIWITTDGGQNDSLGVLRAPLSGFVNEGLKLCGPPWGSSAHGHDSRMRGGTNLSVSTPRSEVHAFTNLGKELVRFQALIDREIGSRDRGFPVGERDRDRFGGVVSVVF